jgi:cation diffusion facilitator CzcD-associated flavoprotein CzcO
MTNQANQAPSKRICVIGAGAAGLAMLKYLSQTSYFKTGSWSVVAYESRSKVGGVWYALSVNYLLLEG